MAENATQTGCCPQFTLRGLLLTVGAIALILGLVVSAIRMAIEGARQDTCRVQLKMLALAVAQYDSKHLCLPPAYATDENGIPTVSWRVMAAQHIWYNYDFPSRMDFSKPWNSPENTPFLNLLHMECWKCPNSKNTKPDITSYVAVVGPGTLWPGGESGDLPKPTGEKIEPDAQSPILLVEWPESDIHWAEPRDITVDEFLDLFRSKSGRSKCHHKDYILYVDAELQVHELPIDSDPDTVRSLLMVDTSR